MKFILPAEHKISTRVFIRFSDLIIISFGKIER